MTVPPAADERVPRRLADLAEMGRIAAGIVAQGQQVYLADDLAGQVSRLAGRQLLIQVGTVAEKLPESFLAGYPNVEWVKIRRMRNLVAHHYDKVIDEFIWESLRSRVPHLLGQLGLARD